MHRTDKDTTRGTTRGMRQWQWCVAAIAVAGASLLGCAEDPPAMNRRGSGGSGGPAAGSGGAAAGGGGAGSSATPGAGGSGSGMGGGGGSSQASGGAGTAGGSGSGGGTGGSSSGGKGPDCAALALPSNPDDVVSTFEDGTGSVNQAAGRGGGFYMFNDGTGKQTPAPGALPDAKAMDRCDGMFALCMSGSGFTVWGAGMGTDLGLAPAAGAGGAGAMTKNAYDGSIYKGISFWAKANTGSALAIRVSLKDANTAPEGGNCDPAVKSGAEACNDDWGKGLNLTTEWVPYTILYSDLSQSSWGKQFSAPDSKKMYSIQFQVNQGLTFDVCIDDLAFVR